MSSRSDFEVEILLAHSIIINYCTKIIQSAGYIPVDLCSFSSKNGMMKASFLNNGKETEAYFGADGQLIATCKMVNPDEVPTNAKIKLAQKYAGYRITEAINYQDADGEAFFVSAENDTQKVIIKSKDGITSVLKKSIKK